MAIGAGYKIAADRLRHNDSGEDMPDEKNVSENAEETAVAKSESSEIQNRDVGAVEAHTPEALLASAIERQLPVESIERLLAMRRELKAEWARERFFHALSEFQAELPPIPKTKPVYNKDGKTVRYHYAPLDQIVETCKPYLREYGFSYTMKPVQEEGAYFVARIVAHHEDGHEEETSFSVPIDEEAYMNAPQKVASARTFAMRYAFCNAFGILTGDQDDDTAQTFGLDDLLSAKEEIKYLDEAKSPETLLENMKLIWSRLAEDDPRRPIVKRYYEKRKGEFGESN